VTNEEHILNFRKVIINIWIVEEIF